MGENPPRSTAPVIPGSAIPGLLIVAAMVMWPVTEAIGERGFVGTPVPQVVWLRYGFHILLMVGVFGWRTRLSFVRTKRPALQLFRSLLMLVMPLCYLLAIERSRPSSLFSVFALAPLAVVGFAWTAGERVPPLPTLLTVVGWLGAMVLYGAPVASLPAGALPAAGMTLSYSAYIVLTRILDRTEGLLTNLFYSALGVFAALSLAAPWFWKPIGKRELLAGCAVAISGWLALLLIELGLRRDTAARLAPFLLTQALLDGGLRAARGASPAGTALLGVVVLAAAVAIAFLARHREAHQRHG